MEKDEKLKPSEFESKWREAWLKHRVYQPDLLGAKKPYYNLMMFPYPSAEGMHVGNMYAFTGADINGRYQRMRGYDVFEPIGLDGFGIHSENYAIKVGKHPSVQAEISEKNFYRQMQNIGSGFAWENRLETYDPQYYRWTQWIFVQMFKAGLAYRKKSKVNFCPSCKTVLSDEQVIEGACERCKTIVEKRDMEQWFFKITKYAEKLLQNTYKEDFQWTQKVVTGQRNWIGKKMGINITYPVVDEKGIRVILSGAKNPGHRAEIITSLDPSPDSHRDQDDNDATITCFTTRPDTNFGATFVVIGPEHPFVHVILNSFQDHEEMPKQVRHDARKGEIQQYVDAVKKVSEQDRISAGRKKTGVFTGFYAINQLTGYKMPIYITDFVLGHVGSGAVVGVPGHDMRDFEFAQAFDIPVIRVVVGKDGDKSPITKPEQVQEEEGIMINSGFLDGVEIQDAIQKMMDHLEKKGWGKRVTTYKLRDWCVSRQRYWGAPIPMIYCANCSSKKISWFTLMNSSSSSVNPKSKIQSSNQAQNPNNPKIGNMNFEFGTSNHEMDGWFPVPDDQLPVLLPDLDDWKPEGTGKGPLAKLKSFVSVACPECRSPARRETDVCDTFLDSSWYFLRYPSIGVQNSKLKSQKSDKDTSDGVRVHSSEVEDSELPWDPEITMKWLPVTQYIGGAEHTVLHLLYARFVTMVLKDFGYVDFEEPFSRFYAHGLIIKDGAKMSKSRGNVVIPDEYIKKYGADALRTYLMFLGPFDMGGDFSDTGIAGMYKFLSRVWRLVISYQLSVVSNMKINNSQPTTHNPQLDRVMHQTIQKVTEDMENFRYNTAIAHIMEYVNQITDNKEQITKENITNLLLLLSAFAPYMTEELWHRITYHVSGITYQKDEEIRNTKYLIPNTGFQSIHLHPWPIYDPKYLVEDTVTIAVQVNGKLRDALEIKNQISKIKDEVELLAKKSEKVAKYLENQMIRKIIFIPGRLINFVV